MTIRVRGRAQGVTRYASSHWPEIGENRFAQIELALDAPAAFVFQIARAIERVDELPLRPNQREFEFIAEFGQLPVVAIAVLAILDVPEPVAQMSTDRRHHGLRKFAALGERLE